MMNAMLNVEFQMLQKVAQQRPEKSENGGSQFRDMLEQRQNAGQTTETAVQEPQAKEQTVPTQETAEPMDDPQMQEQMVMAAMAMLQNPVVYPEQVMQVEQQQTEMPVEMLVTAVPAGNTAAVETAVLTPEMAQQVQSQVEMPVQNTKVETQSVQSGVAVEQTVETKVEAPVKAVEQNANELQTETGRSQRKSDEPVLVNAETETPVFQDVREIPVKVGEATTMQETVETQPVEKQVGDKLVEILDSGENHVEIQLTPENLGRIEVDLSWSKDGTLSVELKAENGLTRSMLEKDTAGLQALLVRNTQREVQVEVQRQPESQQQNFQQDGRGGEQREPQQQQQREEERQNGQDFLQQLRLGLIPLDLAAS